MVLKKEQPLKTILDGLSLLRAACEDRAKLGMLDLHLLAESFFCRFLNEVYGLSLEVLKVGHAAVDLGDEQAGVAYQVTTDHRRSKIQDTLDTYVANKVISTYPAIKVLIIGIRRPSYTITIPKGVAFDPNTDILDVPSLGAYISKLGAARIARIAEIVREEILNTDIKARVAKPGEVLELTLNRQAVKLPITTCTFAPAAGWGLQLVLRNKSEEVLEPDDFNVGFVLPPQLYIKDEWNIEHPTCEYPIRLSQTEALYNLVRFERLLSGATTQCGVPVKVDSKKSVKVGDEIAIKVRVHTKHGNKEYPVKLIVVSTEENLAEIQQRRAKPSAARKAAILQMHSFVRTVEEGGKRLPPISWKRTFGPIDPECENLTKKEMIDRLFAVTDREKLVVYLGAVKGIYAGPMQRRDVQAKYATVCRAFGVSPDELV